jgi:hypothetical protein
MVDAGKLCLQEPGAGMIPRAVSEAALLWAFRLVPVMLLLWYGQLRPGNPQPVPGDNERGYAWLALPAGDPRNNPWLGEWETLSVVEIHGDPGPVAPPPVPAERPGAVGSADETRPFRIRLGGQVREGERVLYCFFDTDDQRWFRMAGDGVDTDAAIRLEVNAGDGKPLVTDLLDGSRYLLLAGEARLERIGFEESTELEELE